MVQRTKETVKRGVTPRASGNDAALLLAERVAALEAERDGLLRELEAAKARIAALEEARSEVASRIDGVIASLGSISE
jgi:hypothetical protein